MPLRAYIKNQEIISINQSNDQWEIFKHQLKAKEISIALSCCKQKGSLKTNKDGIKHFTHLKSNVDCKWKNESPEQIKSKVEIINACRENGWNAIPEYIDGDLKIDVLASSKNKKIAFEMQWKRKSYQEIKDLHSHYNNIGMRVCWLINNVPRELKSYYDTIIANKEMPAFKISINGDSNIIVSIKQNQYPLGIFIDSLFKKKLKLCESIRLKQIQEVAILFFETHCWKCNEKQHCFTVEKSLRTVCDQDFDLMSSMWDNNGIDKHPQVYNAVKLFLNTDKGKELKVGELKQRFSNTIQESYLSNGCFYCDALFGDFFLRMDKMYAQEEPNTIRHNVEIDLGEITRKSSHWCYSEIAEFCM